jgi:hypothetical protein
MTEGAKGVVAGKVLKRDAHGRVHSTGEHRATVLAEFERSGLTGPQFARAAGIPYQTFTSWRKRQAKAVETGDDCPAVVRRRVEPAALRFAEAMVTLPKADAAACAPMLVRLAGGASLEITLAAQVPLAAKLIQALARSC